MLFKHWLPANDLHFLEQGSDPCEPIPKTISGGVLMISRHLRKSVCPSRSHSGPPHRKPVPGEIGEGIVVLGSLSLVIRLMSGHRKKATTCETSDFAKAHLLHAVLTTPAHVSLPLSTGTIQLSGGASRQKSACKLSCRTSFMSTPRSSCPLKHEQTRLIF